jgi:hypothetical protein
LSIALEEGEDLRDPLGRLFEGRPVAAVVEKQRRESAMWLRIAVETSKGTIRARALGLGATLTTLYLNFQKEVEAAAIRGSAARLSRLALRGSSASPCTVTW